MATSKLLKPTNVTISIPEFTDQPDQRVNSNCIDKEADAINLLSDNASTERIAHDTYWEFIRSGNVFIFNFNGFGGADSPYTITNQAYLPNDTARGFVGNADGTSMTRVYVSGTNGVVSIVGRSGSTAYYGSIVWTRY